MDAEEGGKWFKVGIILDPMVTLLFSFSTSSLHLPENSWRSKSTLSSISKPCLCVVQNHGSYSLFFVGGGEGGGVVWSLSLCLFLDKASSPSVPYPFKDALDYGPVSLVQTRSFPYYYNAEVCSMSVPDEL